MFYVHADWLHAKGAQFTTYHAVRRDRITPEDHDFAFAALVKAFPDGKAMSWDTGWRLMSLQVFPTKP